MAGLPSYNLFTAAGTTIVITDWTVVPFNVTVGVEVFSGTGAFGVWYTLDDVNAAQFAQNNQGGQPVYATTTVTWFPDANIGTTATTSTTTNYAFPVRALKCAVTSTLNAQFVVIQGLPYGT